MTTMNNLPPAPYRYAVYYAPNPGTLGWLAGSHWLGRCAALLKPLPQLEIDGVPPEVLQQVTAAPRRYGWHGTLKAPFALAPDADWLTLQQAVHTLARSLQPFDMPLMRVERLDDFIALVPAHTAASHAALQIVAAACVTQLQPLAAPLPDAELARKRASGLTPRQDELLQRWGYPFVLEEFRFHMSLTGSLRHIETATQDVILEAAQDFFADLPPLRFDSLALFAEPAPGADFVLLDHLEMGV